MIKYTDLQVGSIIKINWSQIGNVYYILNTDDSCKIGLKNINGISTANGRFRSKIKMIDDLNESIHDGCISEFEILGCV